MGTIKDKNYRDRADAEEIKKRWKEYAELYKILMNQITVMVWLVTQSQTFWSAKSSGPQEALLLIKLVDMMKFQQNYSNPSKTMPSRFCIHYVSKSGRSSSGHRTGKGQSSSQFPKRVIPNTR